VCGPIDSLAQLTVGMDPYLRWRQAEGLLRSGLPTGLAISSPIDAANWALRV